MKIQGKSIGCYFCMKLIFKKPVLLFPFVKISTVQYIRISYLGIGMELVIRKILLRCNNHDRK
jgi:hypothetical protein